MVKILATVLSLLIAGVFAHAAGPQQTPNPAITNDNATNATVYPTWVRFATGSQPQLVSSTKFTFNPSTGMVTASKLTLTGLGSVTCVSGLAINSSNVVGTVACPGGGSSTGVGVDTGAAEASATGSGTIGGALGTNATRLVKIASGWATGTITLPAISAVSTDSCIRIEDGGNFVDGTHTLTVAANAADGINGGSTGGNTGAYTANGTRIDACVTATHNWNVSAFSLVATTAPTHQFFNSITAQGGLGAAQPGFSDLSGTAAQTQIAPATFVTGTTHTFVAPAEIWECTGTCTVTPPTPAAGYQFVVRTSPGVSAVITIAGVASVLYEKTDFSGYGTANTAATVTAANGNKLCLIGHDATHYDVGCFNGTWSMP
jgi:hypothetical protein